MTYRGSGGETAFIFAGPGGDHVGILHRPESPRTLGVVIVVGGAQYRVGAHRSFVQVARAVACAGFATLRFDQRGVGDTPTDHPGFTAIGPDISAAVDALMRKVPTLDGIVLWGLCDAVPAICQLANQDQRIKGVVLVNPWIRDPASHGRAMLKHYYVKRPIQADFWKNLLRGKSAGADFVRSIANAAKPLKTARGHLASEAQLSLKERVYRDIMRYTGRTLLVLSGNDLTAREFEEAMARLHPTATFGAEDLRSRVDIPEADHTFTSAEAQTRLVQLTCAWLEGCAGQHGASGDPDTAAPVFAMSAVTGETADDASTALTGARTWQQ